MSDNLETANCPVCGHTTLKIDLVLETGRAEPKWRPILLCMRTACTFRQPGWFDDTGHAVFRK